eukprot:Blabericola_migrator_1__1261@NODE_1326_length_4795_cov_131_834179_g891_i0_p2_GENE_NODE_1326_length_4795_cov_131_834179_g891_i0NODE_1326_length_4795_cov_131_834179_g891_i0_p2_ORF_typecomplete_len262_score32_49Bax1I/PF01027_20/2_8e24SLATT_3/PF18184_1/0_42SLATT_3/PF18184_1/1_4e03MIT/PF04212_18/0_29BT1/PF03092_16/99BT1/PF03092_16/0_25Mannosyl_trans2/PF04188_13/2_4Phage_holin_8/PF16931_5/1_3e03Phage_holin_8/PF16931_5/1_8_NODE_1326_length_4795_cov_131_834179_g891_i036634448
MSGRQPNRDIFNSRLNANFDWNKLLEFSDFSSDEQKHLLQVYSLLLGGILVTALGSFTGVQLTPYVNPHLINIMGFLGALGALFYIRYRHAVDPPYIGKGASREEVAAFGGFSFSTGVSMVHLISAALVIQPALIFTALLGAGAIFAALSLSALLARRRSYFFLGSTLGTMLVYLFFARLAALWIPSQLLFNVLTWSGLLMGLGYTLFDTQVMAESMREGNRNVVTHGLALYMDAVQLFSHLLVILMDKDNKEKKRKRNRD